MDSQLEAHEISQVEARLANRFPVLDADVIAAAVRLAHSELTGSIRDFVPLLVERTARDRLAAIADGDEVSVPDEGQPPARITHGRERPARRDPCTAAPATRVWLSA
jgi:hypothetical protein